MELIELRTLGATELRGSDGRLVLSVLSQPKRFALLVYLVLESERGFVRRDTLLALFWPTKDADHARNALRQSLHYLRKSLGKGVIVSRGDEEVVADLDLISCDVLELRRAVGNDDLAAAWTRGSGDFFDAFFVSDASADWDEWVEETRTGVRRLVARLLSAPALPVVQDSVRSAEDPPDSATNAGTGQRTPSPANRMRLFGAVTVGLVGGYLLFGGDSQISPVSLPPAATVSGQVLWVDDNPENNREEVALLDSLGFPVITVENTTQALERYEASRFMAVVTDMGRYEGPDGEYVPGAGLELLRQLEQIHGRVHLIIYTSPAAVVDFSDRALEAGAIGITASRDELFALIGIPSLR